jgi:hypothetical protein
MALAETDQAALWGERAARAPRAHPLIELIAAVGHGLNGDDARALAWAKSALARQPSLKASDFLAAFPFRDRDMRRQVFSTLERLGL